MGPNMGEGKRMGILGKGERTGRRSPPVYRGRGPLKAVRGCGERMPICTPNKVLYIVLHAHYYTVARHPLTTMWSPPPINRGRAPSGTFTLLIYTI